MSDFSDRLDALLDHLGISSYKLSKEIGASEAVISNARSGKNKPSFDLLSKILNKYKVVDANWLLSGQGSMLKKGPERAHTLGRTNEDHAARESSAALTPKPTEPDVRPTSRKSVRPTVRPSRNLGLPRVVTVDKIGRDNVVLVPIRARAGYLLGYGDAEYIGELPSYHLPGITQGTYRMFEVEGQSMVPTLKHSDLVIAEWCESFDDIIDGRVYVLVTKNDGIIVKRCLNRISKYGFILAKSDSVTNREMYPNIKLPPEDVIEVWSVKSFLSADLSEPSDIWNRLNDLEAAVESLKGLPPR